MVSPGEAMFLVNVGQHSTLGVAHGEFRSFSLQELFVQIISYPVGIFYPGHPRRARVNAFGKILWLINEGR